MGREVGALHIRIMPGRCMLTEFIGCEAGRSTKPSASAAAVFWKLPKCGSALLY
jgi:hypothetical protein